ncbi:right-handed parallel beta-helix repeat-containing protein [Parafrankia elaeagni]|uniref:right-handed parallel beta-helix repeat-containing protein n=1 Tax=Parafrankia elaeagni TaxID=222534 RepID=UPI00039D8743|nr:NosD domain-containing protein [Parafrankia elaeagni]
MTTSHPGHSGHGGQTDQLSHGGQAGPLGRTGPLGQAGPLGRTGPLGQTGPLSRTGPLSAASTLSLPSGGPDPALAAELLRRQRARHRGVYLLLAVMTLLSAVTLSVTVGRDYRELTSTAEFFHRHAYTPSYDPLSNVILGLPPNTIDVATSRPSPDIRGIALRTSDIALVAGGELVRSIPLPRPVTGLMDVVRAVDDSSWISDDGNGRVSVSAALVVSPGAELTISAPVRELVLTVRRGVLLGVDGGRLTLDGVSVRPDVPGGDPLLLAVDERRPFVVATNRATLVITRSHLSYLGRDWNSSYGVSWSDGSTGSMTHSEVDHSFIGTYTDHARDVAIERNWFHDNTLYGVDPHSYSTGIAVRHNVSERNGRHGIIFSDFVTGGVVEGNITRDNRLNGIMMDASSTGNRIVGNISSGNRGDGIVLASSPHNVIADNRIVDNRVGIQARGERENLEVRGNTLVDNQLAAQGVDLAGNTLRDNGSQWRPRVLIGIWSSVPAVLVLLGGVTGLARRRRARHGGRPALAARF